MNIYGRKSVCLHMLQTRHIAGVTMIELLVVLSIAAIMLTIAVPSFNTLLTESRLATLANSFNTQLHLARNEAIKRNTRVALCKSADGVNCTTAGSWGQGWIAFQDVDNDAIADAGEEVLRVNEAIPAHWVLKGNTNVANYVSYASMGGARLKSGAFQAGTLTLCKTSSSSGNARSIVISSTGRPRIEKVTVSTCP